MGPAGGEFGIRGFLAAFDVATGNEAWRFNLVPGPGEPGFDTWQGDSWKTGGASIWLTGSYDPELNLTYWGVGNPGPDWNGDNREGDNLYSNSVVALDADTGKLKWHFQFSPHDEFDYDAVQIPVLADAQWQGQPRKLMYFANRNGYFYVLDRATGQFLSGKPFVEVNWASGLDPKTGRPIRVAGKAPSAPPGTLIFPGNQGGTNWYSPSLQPAHRPVLHSDVGELQQPVRAETRSSTSKGADSPAAAARAPVPGIRAGQGGYSWAKAEEGYGAVRAIDPNTGALRLGIQDERSHVGRHPDDGVERAVQRERRRLLLRARRAHREPAVEDAARFGRPLGTDELCGQRQTARRRRCGQRAVRVQAARVTAIKQRRRSYEVTLEASGGFALDRVRADRSSGYLRVCRFFRSQPGGSAPAGGLSPA